MDEDLFVPLLPKLSATRIDVSKEFILQMAITALKLTTTRTVHYEEDETAFFSIIEIHVPPEINMPRLITKLFAGEYCPTKEEAIESASHTTLLYMQTVNIVLVNDLHLPQLVKCRKELVQAKSWSDIFEHETVRLKKKVSALERELLSLKESSVLHMSVNPNTGAKDLKQEHNTAQLALSSSDGNNNDADANKQGINLVSFHIKPEPSMMTAEKHGDTSAIQQMSTPPYECNVLDHLPDERTHNNKTKENLTTAWSPSSSSASRNKNKERATGVRKALFTSDEDEMEI